MSINPLPLIVYVHVPKTAGSTVNSILRRCSHRGQSDCHLHAERGGDCFSFLSLARKSDWLSGHVFREDFAEALAWCRRELEYFGTVRDPVAQLVSHLNFSFERYHKHYDQSLPEEQILDADIVSTNFSDTHAVKGLLLRNPGFLNHQSGFILGRNYVKLADDEVARRLATYTYIATEHTLNKMYQAFGFAELPDDIFETHENTTTPHFDADIFRTPDLENFLARHHGHDFRLYAAVSNAAWPAATRDPCRSSFFNAQVITADNFDEEAYLDSNPDVAEAVSQGRFPSGRAHFDSFGHSEQRTSRIQIDPVAADAGSRLGSTPLDRTPSPRKTDPTPASA